MERYSPARNSEYIRYSHVSTIMFGVRCKINWVIDEPFDGKQKETKLERSEIDSGRLRKNWIIIANSSDDGQYPIANFYLTLFISQLYLIDAILRGKKDSTLYS